jgi:hypothetical protein
MKKNHLCTVLFAALYILGVISDVHVYVYLYNYMQLHASFLKKRNENWLCSEMACGWRSAKKFSKCKSAKHLSANAESWLIQRTYQLIGTSN